MPESPPWFAALLAAAPAEVREALSARPEDAAALVEAAERARDQWSMLALPREPWAQHLGARLLAADPAATGLCLEDLALACACTLGLPRATEAFVHRHSADIDRAIASFADAATRELREDLVARLVVADADRPPRIAAYTGRGKLGRWVSVAARRLAIDRTRAAEHLPQAGLGTDDAVVAAYGDPELALLRDDSRERFRRAVEHASASLDPRERNMLRYHYVHKLAFDEIAGIYRVDPATARRRFARIRDTLVARIREHLREQLGVKDDELDREFAVAPSALQITLARVFKDPR